jgi:hypothetical protein
VSNLSGVLVSTKSDEGVGVLAVRTAAAPSASLASESQGSVSLEAVDVDEEERPVGEGLRPVRSSCHLMVPPGVPDARLGA